jgi:nicotinamide mononucleotide adenylyltransferase
MTEKIYGIYSGGFKPFHKGHWKALQIASSQCTEVSLYISTQNRIRNDEYPIYADETRHIWKNFYESSIPRNVTVTFHSEPIKAAMEQIGHLNEHSDSQYGKIIIFGDETDLKKTYGDFSKLEKVCGKLVEKKRIALEYTPRICSGKDLRYELQHDLQNRFINNLPEFLDHDQKRKIYHTLRVQRNFGELVSIRPEFWLLEANSEGKVINDSYNNGRYSNVYGNHCYFLHIKYVFVDEFQYKYSLVFYGNKFFLTDPRALIKK